MTDMRAVQTFLHQAGWVAGPRAVRFLAAGEYNENFLVEGAEGRFVFRINHAQ